MSIVRTLTIVAIFFARTVAAAAISEDIPVPGGTVRLAQAIGLETPPDPARFIAEIARLVHGLPEGHRDDPTSRLNRLKAHLEVADRFQTAVDAIPGGDFVLTLTGNGRNKLSDALELIGFKLRENRGKVTIEPTKDRAAAARVELLADLGLDLKGLDTRLNAGETVHLAIPSENVPLPLQVSWWNEVVFHRQQSPSRLFAAILLDPQAALFAHGLAGLDDETLTYFGETKRLAERVQRSEAAAFATFASNLRVHQSRVVTPGGETAVHQWEVVVGEKVTNPEAFIRELLARENGHLAYLYDVIAELDAPRARFALSQWIPDERERVERFVALTATVVTATSDWQIDVDPFGRPLNDVAWLFLNVPVSSNGAPGSPSSRVFWARVFESAELPDDPASYLRNLDSEGAIDAAFLAQAVFSDKKLRGDRLEQLAFGLRVFAGADAATLGDALIATRALPAYPALMRTFERVNVHTPSTYAAAARAARRLTDLSPEKSWLALQQFQGAIAIASRMVMVGGLDVSRFERLTVSVSALPLKDDQYAARVTEWVRAELLPAIAAKPDAEQAVLAALGGVRSGTVPSPARVNWEGENYNVDLSAFETRRLRLIRERQKSYSINTALDVDAVAQALSSPSIDLDGIKTAMTRLQALTPSLSLPPKKELFPLGISDLPDHREIVNKAIKDLQRITKPNDAKKASQIAEPLFELSGMVLAEALTSLTYAVVLGQPSNANVVGPDLFRRHDFGYVLRDDAQKRQAPWTIPRQVIETGMPRRIMGSLLGLDVALAQLSLRRVMLEGIGKAPVLFSNDRETFVRSVALVNPFMLKDTDRDAIASAITRGRQRVNALAASPATLDAVAADVKLDGWRRQALEWDVAHAPAAVPTMFSLHELLVLGGNQADLGAWGTDGTPLSGCLCSYLGPPNLWRLVGGRPQLGVVATSVTDVNLHVAEMLATLKLPAALMPTVLGAAMQEFVDQVRPNDANDWLTLVRGASAASRTRIEDFVAAATADGPLVPESRRAEQQP